MGSFMRSIVRVAAALMVLVLASSPVFMESTGSSGEPGPEILVYSNNIENLLTMGEDCQGDWDELVHYIADRDAPDLILLQQVGGQSQVDKFIKELERFGSARYRGVTADVKPDGGGRCGAEKGRQLNAIVWNTATLSLAKGSARVWQSLRANPKAKGEQCVVNDQSRTVNLKAGFTHRSGQGITAASIHWPTHESGNSLCADDNARLLDTELREKSYRDSALQVVGGDMNYGDINRKLKWCKWYRQMRSGSGFADPLRSGCGKDVDCVKKLWTHIRYFGQDGKKRRIDYLFARRGTSAPAEYRDQKIVGFADADAAEDRHRREDESACQTYLDRPGCHYSEHRAVSATLW